MDFSILTEYFVLVVLVGCLVLGYILKNSFPSVPNNKIPFILAIVGIILNFVKSGMSIDSIVWGALMGLASTGLHQAFTRFVENGSKED